VKSNAPALFYEALRNAIGATSMMPLNMLEKATTKKIVDIPILNDLYFLYISFTIYLIMV
jgi:hypothetical protein